MSKRIKRGDPIIVINLQITPQDQKKALMLSLSSCSELHFKISRPPSSLQGSRSVILTTYFHFLDFSFHQYISDEKEEEKWGDDDQVR